MTEQSPRGSSSSLAPDLDSLQQRANAQHARHRQVRTARTASWQPATTLLRSPASTLRNLPPRFMLHAVVALLIPASVALSQVQPGVLLSERGRASNSAVSYDIGAPVAPLSLAQHTHVGDAPILDTDVPVPITSLSRSEALAPIMVPSTIGAERIMLRNGPGTNYDAVGRMMKGAQVQVIGRYGDWFQVRERIDAPVYWVAGELLDMSEAARNTLYDTPESAIPAPPPPKIGYVRDNGVQLRDGPGTNYVPMNSLIQGQVDLVERYEDWLYISVAGQEGWVRQDLIDTDAGMLGRLMVSETIPDANPARVATVSENQVNMRKGPDSRYAAVGQIDAGAQVELLGKHNGWVKVQNGDTVAWVFGDLLSVSDFVMRRVSPTTDFPALPQPKRTTVAASSGGGGGGGGGGGSARASSADLANIAASGDMASFALQFVGLPYIWGAESPSRGFDCSGLTKYVTRMVAGVNIPHNAAMQYNSAYGAIIGSMEELAPGDLVFYVNTAGPGITHVAIYIGGGQIVHALSPRYGVGVSNMWENYYASRFYGGLRVRR